MASILRIDTLQNLAGTTAATLDGNGMLSVAQRFKLPQFAFAIPVNVPNKNTDNIVKSIFLIFIILLT